MPLLFQNSYLEVNYLTFLEQHVVRLGFLDVPNFLWYWQFLILGL